MPDFFSLMLAMFFAVMAARSFDRATIVARRMLHRKFTAARLEREKPKKLLENVHVWMMENGPPPCKECRTPGCPFCDIAKYVEEHKLVPAATKLLIGAAK